MRQSTGTREVQGEGKGFGLCGAKAIPRYRENQEPFAMSLRQNHFDSSTDEITRNGDSWRVQLVLPREGGSQLHLVGIQTSTLDEAKQLSAKAMQTENPKHICSSSCTDWEEF